METAGDGDLRPGRLFFVRKCPNQLRRTKMPIKDPTSWENPTNDRTIPSNYLPTRDDPIHTHTLSSRARRPHTLIPHSFLLGSSRASRRTTTSPPRAFFRNQTSDHAGTGTWRGRERERAREHVRVMYILRADTKDRLWAGSKRESGRECVL